MEENKKNVFEKVKECASNAVSSVKKTAKSATDWVSENPVTSVAIALTLKSSTSKLYRAYKSHQNEVHRNRIFYDPRRGRYVEARRDLRSWELDEIEARYARDKNESYYHILRDMDLIR